MRTDATVILISEPGLERHEINDGWFGSFHALKNVSVDFDSGELVGLVGDNGAGKTTLIRVLSGGERQSVKIGRAVELRTA